MLVLVLVLVFVFVFVFVFARHAANRVSRASATEDGGRKSTPSAGVPGVRVALTSEGGRGGARGSKQSVGQNL